MAFKITSKGVAWLYSEIGALLDIWADPEIQEQLAGRLHNMCIYDKISNRLSDLGIQRTGEQCREKIKKLRRDYKTVVDNNYSPAFARKVLGCYDKVHEVFGKCSIVKPPFVIESLVYNENDSIEQSQVNHKNQLKDIEGDVSSSEINLNTNCGFQKESYEQSKSPIKKRKRLITELDNFKNDKSKLLHQQIDLFNRFINLETEQNEKVLLMQRERLLKEEEQRREKRQKEINIFKSVLYLFAEKKGFHLNLQ